MPHPLPTLCRPIHRPARRAHAGAAAVRPTGLAHAPRRLCAAIALALGSGLLAPPAVAADLTWNGQLSPPLWSSTVFGLSNWTNGLRPQGGDKLTFAGTTGLSNNNDYVGLLVTGMSFAAGAGAFTLQGNDANRLTLAGGLTNNSGVVQTINLPIDVRNVLSQQWDGGAQGMVINRSVTLGNLVTLNLVNKTSINDPNLFKVGAGGNDSVLMVTSGSTVTSQGGAIGNVSSDGRVTVTGIDSRWTSANLTVGERGRGTLTVDSGGSVTSAYGTLGFAQGGSGTASVTGTNSQWILSRDLRVGDGGAGTLTIANGGLVSSQIGYVGAVGGSTVTVSGANSRWVNSGGLSVGDRGIGQGNLVIQDGGFVSSASGVIGGTSDGAVRMTEANSQWVVAGALDIGGRGNGSLLIQSGATASAGALTIRNSGVLNLSGGTLQIHDAALEGAGQFNWTAGTLRITAAGATLGAGASLLDSITTLPANKALEFSHSFAVGSGNQLLLAGGTLGGTGTLLNDGYLAGFGHLAGSGGFSNSGLLVQSGGNLVLSNTGPNGNTGNWELLPGFELQLSGATLANRGTINLNGATVSGTGTLANAVGGTVFGRGNITANFSNAGALVLESGTTRVSQPFTNSGQIQMSSNAATLAGGLISNSGQIEGHGRVGNAVDNTGLLQALGGTLTFAGALANTGSGVIAAGSGTKVLVSAGLARNEARIQLDGGTFDNSGAALVNATAGTISGFGTLRSGGLVNDGKLLLAAGTSAVHADVRANAGSQMILSGQGNTAFYGAVDVQGGAELRVSQGAVATFFGMVNQRSGASFTGTGYKYYEGGLAVGNSPGLGSDAGSVTFGASNTYTAEIGGTEPGDALGNGIQFDRYVVAGTLTFGGTLAVVAWDGFAPQAGQRFDLFDWGSSQGAFEVLNFAQAPLAGGLTWDTSRLYIDGSLAVAAVPEPASTSLLLAGLGVVGWLARRRPRACAAACTG